MKHIAVQQEKNYNFAIIIIIMDPFNNIIKGPFNITPTLLKDLKLTKESFHVIDFQDRLDNVEEKNISKHLRKCKKFWQLGGCYIGVTKVYVLPFRHLILCFLSNGGLDVFSSSHHFSTLCPVFISYLVPLFRASIGSEWYTMFTMITLQPNERITSLDKGTREWNDNIVTQRHHNTMTWWQDDMIIWWHDNTMTQCHFRSSEAESKQPLLSCWLP